jgi:hypothetical protein
MVSSADAQDPMVGFLYALQSPISKKKYPQRFRVLRFLGYNVVLMDDALKFLKKAREDPEWKTVLDENRNITFYQDYENEHGLRQTVGVKIPIDAVEVEEFQSTRP